MSSGGGGSQTTASGIAPEFKPYLQRALGEATKHTFDQPGGLGAAVADTAQVEKDLQAARGVSQEALGGIDQAALQRQLANTAGQLQMGQQGNLGSARHDRATQAALADQAVALQQADLAQKAQGAQGLAQLGMQQRALEQEKLDAPHTALQRYFGYLGNVGQQQTTSQGGGK